MNNTSLFVHLFIHHWKLIKLKLPRRSKDKEKGKETEKEKEKEKKRMPIFGAIEVLTTFVAALVIVNAEQIELAQQQIECEIRLVSLKEELKELLMAGINLLHQAIQAVDRMQIPSALLCLFFCVVTASVFYVTLWKQSSHYNLELMLGLYYLSWNLMYLKIIVEYNLMHTLILFLPI